MIHREGRGGQQRIVIECDTTGCASTFDGEGGDTWDITWHEAKKEGWTTKQIAGEWLHGCKSCGRPT